MQRRNLLLLSNSRDGQGRYLHHAADAIAECCAGAMNAAFIPFADVTRSFDEYCERAQGAFDRSGVRLQSIHGVAAPRDFLATADAIVIGGGNTFHLLRGLQDLALLEVIRDRVFAGVPYIGWSAGSVVACPTLSTTNDMPIIAPRSFEALSLVSFQVNAHFTDAHPPGFQGETRRQRIAEYLMVNPDTPVVGLPEGDWLRVRGAEVRLEGQFPAHLFRSNSQVIELVPGSVLDLE